MNELLLLFLYINSSDRKKWCKTATAFALNNDSSSWSSGIGRSVGEVGEFTEWAGFPFKFGLEKLGFDEVPEKFDWNAEEEDDDKEEE